VFTVLTLLYGVGVFCLLSGMGMMSARVHTYIHLVTPDSRTGLNLLVNGIT